MRVHPKILLSTVYRRHRNDYYDAVGPNAATPFRFALVRYISFGLRFIKQNIPEIEIVEYPSWNEYRKKLKEGWDVVGFSFYQNEIHEILRMAGEARRQGVRELWAGNYGALMEGMDLHFDRVFTGYAERQIAALLGKKLDQILHPPLFLCLHLNPLNRFLNFRFKIIGILFTQRGCPFQCNFCQTPVFCPKPSKISIESIEAVLKYYLKVGIKEVIIPDENFCTFRTHSAKVVELMKRYGFYWSVCIRADELLKHLDDWKDHRLATTMIGIESLSNDMLYDVGKRETIQAIKTAIRKVQESKRWSLGTYMIGYESGTEESIRSDLTELANADNDFTQLCVVKPYPRTPLWREVDSKYGIFEKDWHKWDARHLVWNHPHVSPQKMEELFQWGIRRLNRASGYFRGVARWTNLYFNRPG